MVVLTVVMSRLGTHAGAEGTLGDFCRAALEHGHHCQVVVGRSTHSQRKKLQITLRKHALKHGKISVFSAWRVLDFRVARGVSAQDFSKPRQLPWSSIRFLLQPMRWKVRLRLQRSTHVITGKVLTQRGERELRDLCPQATNILNHNGEPKDFFEQWSKSQPGTKNKLTRQAKEGYAASLEVFDRFLFQSTGQKSAFLELAPRYETRSLVIWPSCDEKSVQSNAQLPNPLPPDKFNLVCVGKFQKNKGQLELLEAFKAVRASLPEAHLSFVGGSIQDRSYLNECKALAHDPRLAGHVTFFGPRTDAPSFIAHCDIFILVSRGEGVSRSIREAAFLQKPIVAHRADGTVSFLTEAGAFYPDSDQSQKIAQSIVRAAEGIQARKEVSHVAGDRYATLATWIKFSSAVQDLLTES